MRENVAIIFRPWPIVILNIKLTNCNEKKLLVMHENLPIFISLWPIVMFQKRNLKKLDNVHQL